jgi:hypothetical protein
MRLFLMLFLPSPPSALLQPLAVRVGMGMLLHESVSVKVAIQGPPHPVLLPLGGGEGTPWKALAPLGEGLGEGAYAST